MGVSEAMATFVADKCKKGNCAGCKHQRCSHECHRAEIEQTEEATGLDGPHGPHESPGTGMPMEGIEVPVGEAGTLVSGGGASAEPKQPSDGPEVLSEAPAGVIFDELPIDWVVPSPDNVRRDLGDLSGLVESIKANGVLEPVVVVPCDEPDGDDHRYHLIAGERRWTAAQEAGLREIPAMVRSTISDEVRVELMLVENLQRKDLDPLEEADGYHRLVDLGMSQHTIASRVGCSQAHVSKRISLLGLAPKVVAAIADGKLTVSEALELGKLDDHKHQEAALKKAKEKSYTGEVGVDYAVEQQLRDIKDAEKKAAIEAEALKKGWSVVERDPRDYREKGYKRLVKETWDSGLHVEAKAHRKEPCHALLVDSGYDGPRKVEICTAPARHTAKGESELKEPAAEKRPFNERDKRDREEAKAKKAAGARRLEFLTERLDRKVSREDALPLVCRALLHRAEHEAKKYATKLLGLDGDAHRVVDAEATKSTEDLVRAAVACALGTGEAYARATWTGWESAPVQALYDFLRAEGYELDEFEQSQMQARERERAEAEANRVRMLEMAATADVPEQVRMVLEQRIREANEYEVAEFFDNGQEERKTLTWWFEVCRVCGCTEDNACEGGCSWVEDDLCSSHADNTADSEGIADADKEPANA